MAPIIGRARASAGPFLIALGAVLALLVAAIVALMLPAALPWLGAAIAIGVAAGSWIRSARLRDRVDRLSREFDTLAQHLVRIEGRPAPVADQSGLRDSVAEVTAEIGLLGGIVRELAVAVESQDRDVAELKEQARPAPAGTVAAPIYDVRPPPEPARRAERAMPLERIVADQRPAPVSVPTPRPAPDAAAIRVAAAAAAAIAAREESDRRVAAVATAVAEGEIEVQLQPVVVLPQRRVLFYEVLARLRLPDGLVGPAEFLPLLERTGRVPDLDRFMLARSVAIARHLSQRGSGAAVAWGLSPVSVAEPGFLRALGKSFDAQPGGAERLILSLPQRSWRALDAEPAGALAALGERGVVFALDRAVDLRIDPQALAERGVRYVKLPASLLVAATPDRPLAGTRSDIAIGDLAAVLSRAGIQLIAAGVEREEDVPDLLDLDVPLAQGAAFSPPRPVRADVLAPPSPAASPAPEQPAASEPPAAAAPAHDAPAEEPADPQPATRRPFRDFLRRAG